MSRLFLVGLSLVMGLTGAAEAASQTVAANTEGRNTKPGEVSALLRPARLVVTAMPLPVAIQELAERSEVSIAFSPSRLANSGRVDCDCADLTVGEALRRILSGTEFEYLVLGNQIVIAEWLSRRTLDSLRRQPAQLAGWSGSLASGLGGPLTANGSRASEGLRLHDHGVSSRRVHRPTATRSQNFGTIRGTVTGSGSQPIVSAQVSIPQLSMGGLTGANGSYQIQNVPAGTHTITVQFLGYASQSREVTVGAGETVEANFTLIQSAISVEGVVVTALGIPREERALGYSVDNLPALDAVPVQNMSAALAGQSAGLQVRSTGAIGGSTSVVLRGFSSISGSNQVLFIVDGIPVDNSSRTECNVGCSGNLSDNNLGRSGVDYGNGIQDINPSDIESVSVLKGANAAALYGSRASNGVVIITTKKGRGTQGFQITGGVGFTASTPLRMPTFQNKYGGGQTPTGYNWVNGAGAGFNDATDESWGPPLDGTVRSQFFGTAPFLPSPYSPRSFYEAGYDASTNIAVSAGADGRHVRFSVTRLDSKGMVPSATLDRTTFNLAGGSQLSESTRLSASASYMKTRGEDRPIFRGYPGGMGVVFSYWQRQNDIHTLKRTYEHWLATGEYPRDGHPANRGPNWNHNFFDSPYYTVLQRSTDDTRDRLTGSVEIEHQLTSWLSALGRVGTDWQTHRQFERFPVSLGDPAGAFINRKIYQQETNAEALFTGQFQLSENIQMSASAGGNLRRSTNDDEYIRVARLLTPGVYNVSNSAVPPQQVVLLAKKSVNSVYGLAQLSYKNYLFLDVTGRNDWSSTLPDGENAYFYPSLSSSVVLSDIFNLPEVLSFAKIRGSWAKVGSDAQPYQLQSTFDQGAFWGSIPSFTHPDQLANANLKPEETVAVEVGTELRFAADRGSLDLTYYKTNTSDQILPVDITHTTGYARRVLNAGEVQNQGIEVVAAWDILRNPEGLTWTLTGNWARNRSEVVSLIDGLDNIILNTHRGLTLEARVGERYGAFMGQTYARDANGRKLVNFDGTPVRTQEKQLLGHVEPDWTGGLRNSFSYGGLDLSVLLDVRKGGTIFCHTCTIQRRTGQLLETLEGRDDFQLVFDGLLPDGTENTRGLPLPVYWRQKYVVFEEGMYDASFVKLREVAFGFEVPSSIMAALPFASGRISVVGRDLLLFTDVPHIDPEATASTGNAQGIENFLPPSPRSFGLTFNFR